MNFRFRLRNGSFALCSILDCGVHTALSPFGPWSKVAQAAQCTKTVHQQLCYCNNPSPWLHKNGTIYLACANIGPNVDGIWRSQNLTGPWELVVGHMTFGHVRSDGHRPPVGGGFEDPHLYTVSPGPPALKTDDSDAGDEDSCSTWYERTQHSTTGVYRSVKDPRFGAKGDGVTDDTAAIQAALDYRKDDAALKLSPVMQFGDAGPQKAPSVIYLPPGRYLITDTLVLLFYTHLVGNFRCPPTIVLKPHSPGFTDKSAGLRPAIAAGNGFNTSLHDYWDDGENMAFYTQILHLRLEIGAGNAAATGIMWGVAQQTTIRDTVIDAGPAAIGLDVSGDSTYAKKRSGIGIGGGGTIEDVTVHGGGIGLKITSSQWALRGITIDGAVSVGILCGRNENVQFVDIAVSSTPVGVQLAGGSSYVILDARFKGTAVAISGARPVFVENVTADASVTHLFGSGPGINVSALPADKAYWQGEAYLSGVKSNASHGLVSASRMRRESRPRPTFDVAANQIPANVLSFGAKGDGHHDDTAAFVKAIAASEVVFVPWGLFRITDTLVLRSDTKIVGEGLAHIWLGNSSKGFEDPANPKPLILTPDDPAAEVWLADLRLTCGSGNRGAITVKWMAGSASGIWDVHIPFFNPQAMLFHLDEQGGGTFANIWFWGAVSADTFSTCLYLPSMFSDACAHEDDFVLPVRTMTSIRTNRSLTRRAAVAPRHPTSTDSSRRAVDRHGSTELPPSTTQCGLGCCTTPATL